jgi:hypothetical protein
VEPAPLVTVRWASSTLFAGWDVLERVHVSWVRELLLRFFLSEFHFGASGLGGWHSHTSGGTVTPRRPQRPQHS